MTTATLNSKIAANMNPLNPAYVRLDSRTPSERLAFAAKYGRLINFYDTQNRKKGNWSPFFLKDPIILTAFIANTNYDKTYSIYAKATKELGYCIVNQKHKLITFQFNVLFELYEFMFQELNYWLGFMLEDPKSYNLKDYLIQNIETTFGPLLWALLDFNTALYYSEKYPGLRKPNMGNYEDFPQQWRMGTGSYASLLGLDIDAGSNSSEEIFEALKLVGNKLFGFYVKIIRNAEQAHEELLASDDIYPDTTLLIAFVKLLKVQQMQLNGITAKHLNFYYKDILKQSKELARPDTTYLIVTLGENTTSFTLPAGTPFPAGADEDQQPIIFNSNRATVLSEAALVTSYTVTEGKSQLQKDFKQLYQYVNETPFELETTESGATAPRPFLDATKGESTQIDLGFAVASPMFYLQQGKRKLKITLDFTAWIHVSLLKNASYYFTTAEGWVDATDNCVCTRPKRGTRLVLTFEFDPAFAPIEAFADNEDGYTSEWPVLKVVIPEFYGKKPPSLVGMTVHNKVEEMKNFVLNNDFGGLTAEAPFQPFGTIVNKGNNFYLGSAEIFSKTIDTLDLNFTWNNLPEQGFAEYYKQYNKYLEGELCEEVQRDCGSTYPYEDPIIYSAATAAASAVASSVHIQAEVVAPESVQEPVSNVTAVEPAQVPEQKLPWWKRLWNWLTGKRASASSTSNVEQDVQPEAEEKAPVPTPVSAPQPAAVLTPQPLPTYSTPSNNYWEDSLPDCGDEQLFSDEAFKVEFAGLAEARWETLQFDSVTGNSSLQNNGLELFDDSTNCAWGQSCYSYKKIGQQWPIKATPELQLQPLEFTQDAITGFLRLDLSEPTYGFGFDLYSEVVAAVTTCNALSITEIAKGDGTGIEIYDAPKTPFTPTASQLSVTYTATEEYSFDDSGSQTGFEFYHYGVFETYQVQPEILDDNTGAEYALPLYEALPGNGTIYLQFQNVTAPVPMTMLFDLATEVEPDKPLIDRKLSYQYLSTAGWEEMPVLDNDTKGFRCTGILGVSWPDNTTDSNPIMPADSYWMAISTKAAPAAFPDLVYLNTQVITVTRGGVNYLPDKNTPTLLPDTITAPLDQIPQIAEVVNPFPSFGGRGAESSMQFYTRVSKRIKDKNRPIVKSDFREFICQNEPLIYDVKTITKGVKTAPVKLGLVRKVDYWREAGAFRPFVTECVQSNVAEALKQVVSPFARWKVFSMKFLVLTIGVDITINNPKTSKFLIEELNHQLMIYLSPWIRTEREQVVFDNGVSAGAIAELLNQDEQVLEVSNVRWSTSHKEVDGKVEYNWNYEDEFRPKEQDRLIVTAYQHVFETVPV